MSHSACMYMYSHVYLCTCIDMQAYVPVDMETFTVCIYTCLYISLVRFLHPNPEDPTEVPNGFLSDINPVGHHYSCMYTEVIFLSHVSEFPGGEELGHCGPVSAGGGAIGQVPV